MNRLIKVIYVNILNLFDINKIVVAKQDGVKSSLETKTVITGLVGLLYGYIVYRFFTSFELENKMMILNITFLVSTIVCFVSCLLSITSVVLKGNDNDLLFSMPLSVQQVLFSKLFHIYLKNILFVGLFMISGILSYGYYVHEISDTFILMYLLICFVIPFIPMIISTIVCYISAYYKLRWNRVFYTICKTVIVVCFLLLLIVYFRNISTGSIDIIVSAIYKKFKYLYPLVILFHNCLAKENVLLFVLILFIPGLLLFLFNIMLSNRYLDICSKLQGVGKRKAFIYHKSGNYGRIKGFVRKELCNLLANKSYLRLTLGTCLLFTIAFFVVTFIIEPSSIMGAGDQLKVFNARMPSVLAMFACFNVTTIVSISLERNNLQILRTLPLRASEVLFSKWLVGVLCGSVFVIVNGIIAWVYFKPAMGVVLFSFIYPLFSLMFCSFTALLLDYRFVSKNSINDSDILKGKMINIVPNVIAIVIGVVPLFLILYAPYYRTLASYMLIMFILFIMEIIYLFINRKRLEENLYS